MVGLAFRPEKLRPFRQWQIAAEWPLMDTHPPNPDPQQPGAQPMAQVAAPSAGEQPAFDVQHAIATLDPKVLMELLENDANPIPPTRQPAPPRPGTARRRTAAGPANGTGCRPRARHQAEGPPVGARLAR